MNIFKQLLIFAILISLMSGCKKEKPFGNDNLITKFTFGKENFSSFDVSTNGSPQTFKDVSSKAYQGPNSAYGVKTPIDFSVNNDNTIDIAWQEKDNTIHLTRVSIDNQSKISEIPIPEVVSRNIKSGRFLGFESLGNNKFIIGYSRTNSHNQSNAEARYTAFDISGGVLFSTSIWGEKDVNLDWSKSLPGQASNARITYSPISDKVAIYLGHSMRWPGGSHQGGWIGFLDANTGELIKRNDGKHVGDGWFFSHNFDQRCIAASNGKFYTLAHGDAYPRALGLSMFSHDKGKEVDFRYHAITTGSGNATNAHTGDFVELPNGDIAIAYSALDGRSQRDLKVSIVSGVANNSSSITRSTWLTNHSERYVGWGTKIEEFGDNHLIVGWNEYKGGWTNYTYFESHFALLDRNGENILGKYSFDSHVLYPAQSLKKSSDGKYLIFVSGIEGGLRVHLIDTKL